MSEVFFYFIWGSDLVMRVSFINIVEYEVDKIKFFFDFLWEYLGFFWW